MKTIVLDLGGVLYSYSNKFDASDHEVEFKNGLKSLESMGEFKSILDEYLNEGGTKRVLDAEFYLVHSNLIKVFPIVEAVQRINTDLSDYYKVIVSTSLKKTSEEICKRVGLITIPNLIFDMSDYGSKKDPNAWKAIFKTLTGVDIIVEDSSKNLDAAGLAAKELGFAPSLCSSVMEIS